ncbi:hypothetical protein LEP1GSC058_2351 [Leptospira fainei serovar Hurstbridge str. BUT 6]|uniref:Uncharacterized protein n=1 Tax=Leptospira fainei serovar Hurstbridge str. BUT 6 TaxID=1193011 RepID=S3VCV8_9LEPT|nr:hypothetical protein LEP1GSC058_2351 [Leptospira fainei serovar Hurstbridge str. BUT 6]
MKNLVDSLLVSGLFIIAVSENGQLSLKHEVITEADQPVFVFCLQKALSRFADIAFIKGLITDPNEFHPFLWIHTSNIVQKKRFATDFSSAFLAEKEPWKERLKSIRGIPAN